MNTLAEYNKVLQDTNEHLKDNTIATNEAAKEMMRFNRGAQ